MKTKAIFFDIDGTIQTHTSTPTIPDSTRVAFNELRANGVKLFIATGRPKNSLEEFLNLVDFDFDGWVTMNGQYCFIGDTVIRSATISREELKKAVSFFDENNIGCVIAELDDIYKTNNAICHLHEPIKCISGNELIQRIDENDVYQLMVYLEENKDISLESEMFDLIPNCKSARWISSFIDVIPLSGGKSKGILSILEYYGIQIEESMAFGDGGNDIDMLTFVGKGIAMGNANEFVKSKADYVTDDITNDGIYNALKKLEVI